MSERLSPKPNAKLAPSWLRTCLQCPLMASGPGIVFSVHFGPSIGVPVFQVQISRFKISDSGLHP